MARISIRYKLWIGSKMGLDYYDFRTSSVAVWWQLLFLVSLSEWQPLAGVAFATRSILEVIHDEVNIGGVVFFDVVVEKLKCQVRQIVPWERLQPHRPLRGVGVGAVRVRHLHVCHTNVG